ncbi:MAG: hypothetical protein QXS37_04465 [Candidatus Aenigmatarchaeota archaeon]
MRENKKSKGLLVYGVDYDELAYEVGEMIKTANPEIFDWKMLWS